MGIATDLKPAAGVTLPTQMVSSGALSVVTAAVQSTKGAWVQVVAAVAFAVSQVTIELNTGGFSEVFQWDIGIGGAGSEVVKIPDITTAAPYNILFSIASGSRVAIRAANITNAFQRTIGSVYVQLSG